MAALKRTQAAGAASALPAAKRRSLEPPAIQVEDSDSEECDFSFEAESSCDEFIPTKAQTRRPAAVDCGFIKASPEQPRTPWLPPAVVSQLPSADLPASIEVAALEVLAADGPASNALKYATRESKALSDVAVPALQARLRRWGYGPGALNDILRYIRDEATIVIHIDLAARLSKLQKDTHYRNQFETGSTCGSSDLAKRRSWEDRLFNGVYENAEACDRVKYGVLNMVNDPCGISTVGKQYGKDYLVLRGVRLRTTFSDRDSCNKGQLASCEWYAHVLEKYSDLELRAVAEVALGDRLFVDSAVLDTAAGGYKEVQIHGELVLKKNIEAVVVHPSRRGTPCEKKLKEWCQEISARLEWMPADRESMAETSKAQRSDELRLTAESPLWLWRPRPKPAPTLGQRWPPWVRFDPFASAILEARKRDDANESIGAISWPVGGVLESMDFATMTSEASVGTNTVKVELRRCTAGECAYSRAVGGAEGAESDAGNTDPGAHFTNSASIGVSIMGRKRSRLQSGQAPAPVWEWCASATGNGTWAPYTAKLSSAVELAFQSKNPTVPLTIAGSGYEVDLELMVQINVKTGYRRLVRRTQLLA